MNCNSLPSANIRRPCWSIHAVDTFRLKKLSTVAQCGLGHLREACCYFRKACAVNPSYLLAISNLHNCCNLAVERWHYRMLNDGRRNEAYRSAIMKATSGGCDSVLDIGCGTGILSLFAVEGGARTVYACDGSDIMIQIATQVMESNNASSRVRLINKLSHDLQIPADIPSRVSLVVTEIFDAGLFGEHVLQSLLHAWENLLAPDGEVVPRGAFLWLCAVECPYLVARQRVGEPARQLLKCVAHVVCEQDEPYGCEDLASLPGGFRYLTKPKVACTVNFNNPGEMRRLLRGDLDRNVSARCVQTGVAHAVVAWFSLQLGEEELTTCPRAELRAECWDQAVFPLPVSRFLTAGQRVVFSVCIAEGRLSARICSSGDGGIAGGSSDDDFGTHDVCPRVEGKVEADGVQKGLESLQLKPSSPVADATVGDTRVLTAPQELVSFLNDRQFASCLRQVADVVCGVRSRGGAPSKLCILDLCPFPLLGVLLAGRMHGTEVWCTVQSEPVVRCVADANGIAPEQLRCFTQSELDVLLSSGTQQFDVIMVHLLEPSGKLKESVFLQLPLLRKCLKKDGFFIPRRLIIHGKLVCSDWLDKMSWVLSDNLTCGKKISQFINIYAVPEHCDFHLSAIHHAAYSDPAELLHVELAEAPAQGERAATAHVLPSCSGYVTALPYWYSLVLAEGLRVSTLRDDSYARQAAVIIRPHARVRQGGSVQVRTVLQAGLLHISVLHSELSS